MKRLILSAAMVAGVAAGTAQAGPVARACMAADRSAASRSLCSCIEQVARPIFSPVEMKRIARLFQAPDLSQKLRASTRAADERFWAKYELWSQRAGAQCS